MTMWYLDAYENKSELLAKSYPLQGATSTTIEELIGTNEESGPIEAAMHEVAPADLPRFARYIDGELLIDLGCTYFVGLFAD